MGKVIGPIRVLEREEMELIHRSAIRILSEVGMRIEHEEALLALGALGCRVDHDRQEVKFPPEVVEPAGNTALLGAKLALFSDGYANIRVEHVPLASDPEFQDTFVESMLFP